MTAAIENERTELATLRAQLAEVTAELTAAREAIVELTDEAMTAEARGLAAGREAGRREAFGEAIAAVGTCDDGWDFGDLIEHLEELRALAAPPSPGGAPGRQGTLCYRCSGVGLEAVAGGDDRTCSLCGGTGHAASPGGAAPPAPGETWRRMGGGEDAQVTAVQGGRVLLSSAYGDLTMSVPAFEREFFRVPAPAASPVGPLPALRQCRCADDDYCGGNCPNESAADSIYCRRCDDGYHDREPSAQPTTGPAPDRCGVMDSRNPRIICRKEADHEGDHDLGLDRHGATGPALKGEE